MKRFISLVILTLWGFLAFAQGLSERTYLVTDRQVYVAGDRVWCSAFCMDASTGKLSEFSGIAYIELHDASGMVLTGKVALVGGRGATCLPLPEGLPTGNYKLLAYTAQNKNEVGYDYAFASKTLSIFNSSSSARVEGGVNVVESIPAAAPSAPASGSVRIDVPSVAKASSTVSVGLAVPEGASFSVSVWHDDGIPAPASVTSADFIAGLKPGSTFDYRFIPEYEGEIINGRIVGINPSQADSLAGYSAFISAPGDLTGLYSAGIRKDGTVSFFTNNIYGDMELVCEIENLGRRNPGHIEIDSPFVDAAPGAIPSLAISPDMGPLISARGAASQIERTFDADTLYEALPVRKNPLFNGEGKTYRLDDYTRFPTMEEVIIEYVTEMRTRTWDKNRHIELLLKDYYETSRFSGDNSLMLIDGVPVFDHEKVISYDPLLVRSITIYPYVYSVGLKTYEGIANFETYKGNIPGIEFDANVRIFDFNGPSLPVAFTCGNLSGDKYPDFRQTAYWHPLMTADAGQDIRIPVVLPSYKGRFVVVVEGITADGAPLYATASFVTE